jgi:hypothetical protein
MISPVFIVREYLGVDQICETCSAPCFLFCPCWDKSIICDKQWSELYDLDMFCEHCIDVDGDNYYCTAWRVKEKTTCSECGCSFTLDEFARGMRKCRSSWCIPPIILWRTKKTKNIKLQKSTTPPTTYIYKKKTQWVFRTSTSS